MRVRHLLIILLCIIIFLGCGGGGGSGVGPELVSGHISGQIIFDDTLANERAIIASHSTLRASVFDNALVFLEEMPSRAVYADSDGKFIFTDLPLDTSFHVIARVNSLNGNSYKTRSEEINLTKSKAHITENIRIDKASEAKYQIRLQVKDTRDNNVARCKIWFWGEEFTLDESGSYLSPKMPLGASGNLKIIPPSNKDLLTLDCKIDSTTFQSEIQGVSAVTLPPLGITQKKAPYVSIKVGETLPGGFAIRLYGNAIDPQNDTLELEWSATVGSFTYESIDKKYVDWAVPTEETTAIITLKATQISSLVYPMFWSQAELPVKISKNGSISYPGEIVVKPVSRVFDVVSSATEQITGNTVSSYEIIASFPNDSNLSYTWENSDGSIISGVNNKRMFWRSPTLSANEFKLATLTAYVSDDIATVTKNILVKVTTFPVVTFSSPADSDFYPGLISFRGSAKDYLGNFISYDNFKWYLATFPNELQLIQNEGASFSYDFSTQGSYTVYLSAKDSSGVVGTGSMLISIFNCPPDISILSPENDGGYSSKNHLVFKAKVSDYEDGEITSSEQIKWFSDIDGLIGSGTYFINDKLTKNKKHTISVEAKDSMGQISSTSIIIWYDMPARIVLTPESGAVFYEGSEIALSARGIDANGALLASSTYKWYLDGSDTHWKSGIDSFVAKDLSAGLHSIKVVGSNDNGKVTSEDCYFEVGWPLPKITSPASGTRFDPETDITFTATPPSSGSLVLSWQIDDGETLFANNNNKLTKKLDVGRHTICYQGMDYSGVFASSSIDIVVERLPQIELNIASGSSFFINQQIVFHAECKDSLNNSIGDENIKWYFLDSGSPVFWKTGSLLYMHHGSTEGALAPGLHTIRVEATGPHGSIASKSFSFESGIAPIDIEKPLPDTSYKANENILFEANLKKESMPVAWYIDNVLIHIGSAAFNHSFESNGIYSVKAIATDSANLASSKEMLLCVGLNPVIDFHVKNVENNEIDPSGFIIFEGKPIVFVGSGTNPIDSSSISGRYMTWTIYNEDGTTVQQSYSEQSELTLTIANLSTLSPGTRTVELKCQLNDGLVGKKTKQIYFNLPVATYAYPASDTFIPFDDYTSDTIVCSAVGYPDSVGGINYEWYLNWGKDGCNKLEDDDTDSDGMQLRLKKGENSLTLVATDSLGQVSAITKKIIVDNRPVLAFSPPEDYANSDAYIFDTCEVTLKASGSTAVATGSLLTNYKWYLGEDFINAKTSINGEITGSELGLVTGENIVTLTAEDQFGLVATVSHNIYCGEQLPSILSPEDNHVFQNTNFNIEATGSEHITMNWTLNTNQLSEEHSNILSFEINDLRLNNGDNSITYGGKDSAGNIKTASLNFKYADSDYLPKIEMKYANSTEEVRDSVLFEYEETDNITINGSAIDGSNNPIEASKMTWTLHKQGNEGDKTPFESVSSLLLSRSQLNSVGTWTLTLTATDESGFIATQTQSFYYGYPKPKIQTPSNESLISYTNRTIELKGSYSDLVSRNMNWHIDGVDKGSGNTLSHTFNRGYHTITYIGTDSAGVSKQDTVVCIVNDKPSLEVKYEKIDGFEENLVDNSKFFVNCDLKLMGTAKKADGTELEDSNVAWLKYTSGTDSGTNLVTGTKTPILTNSMLGVGTWYLSFKAEDKDFSSYGFSESYISSFTKKITTGIETPRFIGATAGERIDEDGSITFTVNDISPIVGYWSVEGQAASYSVTEKSGDNMTFTLNNASLNLSRGNHKVYYSGTDSTGKTYTAETSILIDSGPKFEAGYPRIESSFEQLGTATIDGLDYIIIKSDSDAQNLTLSADTISESDSVEWTNLSGTQSYSSNRSLSRNFLVGSYTYKVTITDEFGVNNSDTLSFWIWRYETYDCASPTHIVSNNNSELFVVEDKKTLAKYTRVIDEAAFNSGDIASVASSVSDTDITGLCYADSNLYSLTKDLKYYKWNTSELATDSEITIDDSSITDIGGFLIKNNRVYISDKSGSDNYVKIFYLSGNYWFQSSSSFKQPSDITADSGNNIYVADNQNNKIINLDLDGNDGEHIDGVSTPLGLAYSASTNRLYVTGKNSDNNPCVYVIDLSSYRVLYSFDLDGAYDLAICGTGTNSDLYITDEDGKKIIRLRSNYSW